MNWGKEHSGKFPEIVRQSWQTVENIREELKKSRTEVSIRETTKKSSEK